MGKGFQFKQFFIEQDKCAMKVGTDGVLLGAWAKIQDGNVLDIGSGTGLMALMAAQRNPNVVVDTIDVEENAFIQSTININNSKWKDRVFAHHVALQNYAPNKKYDTIISNPPFFNNTYQPEEQKRNIARQNSLLPFEELAFHVDRLLKKEGVFSVILPVEEEVFVEIAKKHFLCLNRKINVFPNTKKACKRVLLEFSRKEDEVVEGNLIIETDKRHVYSSEYELLTKDFYLEFKRG
ncbi:MAG: methyltransferase [Flavobacteriales bacterium]|nr:methyltransferase [Flavobacteriales bacterium]MCW8913802.1 methyltransferase [Flavobacteriales bacterium]MCW8938438.1 methyltransferase [Flavobacteriales bacterium]MCW8939457.1 methyltransferase [Flavobacteriales bacterium]MCW8968297.1 methyltransferase [Flavobacteriales bacterium]